MTEFSSQITYTLKALVVLGIFLAGVVVVQAQLSNPAVPLHVGTCGSQGGTTISTPCQYKVGSLAIGYASLPATTSMLDASGLLRVQKKPAPGAPGTYEGNLGVITVGAIGGTLDVGGTQNRATVDVTGQISAVNLNPSGRVCANADGVLVICGGGNTGGTSTWPGTTPIPVGGAVGGATTTPPTLPGTTGAGPTTGTPLSPAGGGSSSGTGGGTGFGG